MGYLNGLVLAVLLAITPASAGEHILPVVALNIVASDGAVWNSEAYVTNPGDTTITVYVGSLIEGGRSATPLCLPIVQPFLQVPPFSTRLWSSAELAFGVGCPEWAWGALTLWSDDPAVISSRMVNTGVREVPSNTLLEGFGQEIDAIPTEQIPRAGERLILPAVAWHPNACGAKAFDTNVFFVNPGDDTIDVEISPEPDSPHDIVIDGILVPAPHHFPVPARSLRVLRVAGADPQITVCLEPTVGAFSVVATGPMVVIGSAVDRSTQDARTIVPIRRTP